MTAVILSAQTPATGTHQNGDSNSKSGSVQSKSSSSTSDATSKAEPGNAKTVGAAKPAKVKKSKKTAKSGSPKNVGEDSTTTITRPPEGTTGKGTPTK